MMFPFYTERSERERVKAREFGSWLKSRESEINDRREIPEDVLGQLWEKGYYGYLIPSDRGGTGGSLFDLCLVLEELSPASSSVSLSLLVQSLGIMLLNQDRDLARRDGRLSRVINERKLLAFALSEPCRGRQGSGHETRAEKSGGGYKLSGRKVYVNQGREADFTLVMAESDRGPAIFLIAKGGAGVMVSKDFPRASARGLSWSELIINDALAEASGLVAEPGDGRRICESGLRRAGALVSAMALGLVESVLAAPGGEPFSDAGFPRATAEAKVELEAGRALCYQSAFGMDKNLSGAEALSIASKIFSTELALNFFSRACRSQGAPALSPGHQLKQKLEFAELLGTLLGSNRVLLENLFERQIGGLSAP